MTTVKDNSNNIDTKFISLINRPLNFTFKIKNKYIRGIKKRAIAININP